MAVAVGVGKSVGVEEGNGVDEAYGVDEATGVDEAYGVDEVGRANAGLGLGNINIPSTSRAPPVYTSKILSAATFISGP